MNRVVLITGASSGIGKITAEYLSKNGFIVYGTSRNPNNYPKPLNYNLFHLEINDILSIKNLIKKIILIEKRIDVLINNAGVGITGPGEETSVNEMKNNFNTNFFGPIQLIQEVLPIMRKNKSGYIINITSIAGYFGLPFRGCYSASKAAFGVFTESIRMEVKKNGINICTLAPGEYSTDIATRRYHSPIKNGVYKQVYEKSLIKMNEHVENGDDPSEVALKIFKILNVNNPKVHYKVGSWLQKFSIFLKKILPDFLFEKILMLFYKL